jgi:hypothetical protein
MCAETLRICYTINSTLIVHKRILSFVILGEEIRAYGRLCYKERPRRR